MKREIPIALLVAGVFLACTEAPTNPELPSAVPQLSAAGKPQISEFNFTSFSPCTGENIDFTGTVKV